MKGCVEKLNCCVLAGGRVDMLSSRKEDNEDVNDSNLSSDDDLDDSGD